MCDSYVEGCVGLCSVYEICKNISRGGAYCLQGGIEEHRNGVCPYQDEVQISEQPRENSGDLGSFVSGGSL